MNRLSHPWQRSMGLALAAVVLFVLNPQETNVLHGLALPLLLALAALLLTRSPMAVLIAVFALSAIASDLDAANRIPALAYPLLAVASFVGCLVVIWQRLQARARETHDERWSERRQ